jgi:hypothetical protein
MRRTQLRIVVGTVMLGGCATGAALASRSPLTGVRFSIGTAEISAPARGALGLFDGVVEFAAGRGRLDVTARRDSPPIAVQGVPVAAPLAGPGDYYLFDNAGFVLVRPASQTFSTFVLSESSYRLGDVHEPREGMMEFSRLRADTLAAGDSARLTQHGPFTLRWHLDRRDGGGSARVLVRGWIELSDAPAGEASVVRWFGAAAALAGMRDSIEALPRDSLQVTAAVVLPRFGFGAPGAAAAHVNLITVHPLIRVTVADIDPARLILPPSFTETPWPGFEHASPAAVSPHEATDRWRTFPAAAHEGSP